MTRNQRRANQRRDKHNQRFVTVRPSIRQSDTVGASTGQTRNHKPRNWHMPAGGRRMQVSPFWFDSTTIDRRWDK